MSRSTTRRDFLKTSTAWGIGAALTLDARSWARVPGANERLQIGIIGVAGRGGGNLNSVASQDIVALCDVDAKRLASAAGRFNDAKTYSDWREMIQLKGLDAVVISTPDHHHAPATLWSLKRGLHVYCEKPLTHTVQEARMVTAAARKAGVATQMGTQLHRHHSYARAIELIRSGAIGPVNEVHVITDRPRNWWKQGLKRPTDAPPAPKHLSWDTWLGPAPERPYNPCYVPFKWRGWWDFGCGAIGDMAIHLMDPAVWALKLGGPVKVTSEGPEPLPECGPTWMKTTFSFGPRGELPACNVHWYEGTAKPPDSIAGELPMNGSLFIGAKGRIAVNHGGKARLLPEERFKDHRDPERWIPRAKEKGHHQEWIEACGSGKPTLCGFDYAGPFAEIVLLGNVAYRTGKTIDWDPISGQARGVPEAQRFLSKTYRKGWEI